MSYYNTTGVVNPELRSRMDMAKTQDKKILVFLRAYPNQAFTRDELFRTVLPNARITSVGRSLNTLMKDGLINKIKTFRKGEFNHRQHTWQVALKEPEQRRMFS